MYSLLFHVFNLFRATGCIFVDPPHAPLLSDIFSLAISRVSIDMTRSISLDIRQEDTFILVRH